MKIDMTYWCESCARKNNCYTIRSRPKCFVAITNTDRKTENCSEFPNNCELQTIRCPKCGKTDYIRDMEKDMGIKDSHYKYKCINCNTYIKTEPTQNQHIQSVESVESVGEDRKIENSSEKPNNSERSSE